MKIDRAWSAPGLIEHLKQVDTVTVDKGYGSDTFREFSANKGGKSVISKRNDNNTPQVKID